MQIKDFPNAHKLSFHPIWGIVLNLESLPFKGTIHVSAGDMRSRVPVLTEPLWNRCPNFFKYRRRGEGTVSICLHRVHLREVRRISYLWTFINNFRSRLLRYFWNLLFLELFLRGFAMSTRSGRRSGSGRKRIYDSNATKYKVWNRGHQRIWLDNVIYSSWVSAKSMSGHSSDSKFAGHLLSLEQWRR